MHNIEVVQRILEYFLMYEQQQQKPGTVNVSKLLDNYLAEIARDPTLSIPNFKVLAESLPENARTCDDGLYRAIDTFLKVVYQFHDLRASLILLTHILSNNFILYSLIHQYQSMIAEGYVKS